MLSRTKKILIALCLSVALLSQFTSMNVLAGTMKPPVQEDPVGGGGSKGGGGGGGGGGILPPMKERP